MSEAPQRKRPRLATLRVGFVVGKEDGDLVTAPGLPAAHHRAPEEGDAVPKGGGPLCHSDVAIWWWARTHYGETVECDLITGPADVTRARLVRNDVNLLLGWDAVSAHLEEQGSDEFAAGHGDGMAALLRDSRCKVFPPACLQDFCNAKGTYVRECVQHNVPAAPTVVYNCEKGTVEAGAAFAVDAAKKRGWKKFIVKPSPSSWSRGVEAFLTSAAHRRPERVEKYFREHAFGYQNRAKSILVQRHLGGLVRQPETRCFFVGDEFAYAVANSTHPPGKTFALESCPESASSRDLPAKYWRPHAALAKRVLDEVLPPLYSFDGRRDLCAERYAWPVRVDVGTHALADLDGVAEPSGSRRAACFVNEVEIVPTLYLAAKFGHQQDYVAAYGRSLLKTAFEACGREAPAPDAPAGAAASPLSEAN